jgi:hypothetical protein
MSDSQVGLVTIKTAKAFETGMYLFTSFAFRMRGFWETTTIFGRRFLLYFSLSGNSS